MFFIKRDKGVNILSGNKSGGDTTIEISDLVVDGQKIEISGGYVFVNGESVASVDDRKIVINIQKGAKVDSVVSDVAVNVHGDIQGYVAAHHVNCNRVGGNVEADGNVNCDDVGGNVKAGGNVNCDDIGGNVTTNRVNRG